MEQVTFTTEDGVRLEGELRLPEGDPRGSAVLCHPHPRHGGRKDHPLLWAIRNELAGNRGLAVLGFNFRGVMGSAGTYGGGRDEVRDVRAAIGHVRARSPRTCRRSCSGGPSARTSRSEAAIDDGAWPRSCSSDSPSSPTT